MGGPLNIVCSLQNLLESNAQDRVATGKSERYRWLVYRTEEKELDVIGSHRKWEGGLGRRLS